MTSNDKRLVELEAVRGIAALVVLIHHLLLAFFPRFHGLLFPDERVSPFGTPLFAMINGSAAVVLFFVLSGFVLTVRAFQMQSARPLMLGALKRWPRLALPVLIVNVCAGLLAGWAVYLNQPVAEQIASPWLGWWYAEPGREWRTVAAAVREGAVGTFVKGSAYFNSNLWTMFYEFYGSFLAFAAAGVMLTLRALPAAAFLMAATLLLMFVSPYVACFLAGVGLAALYTGPAWGAFAGWLEQQGRVFWTMVLGVTVLLLGYHEAQSPQVRPAGIYQVLAPLSELAPLQFRVLLHTAGSMIILSAVLALPAARRRLGGPVGAMLGRLSFPTYLLQTPVICLVGPVVYLVLAPAAGMTGALVAAAVASGAATIVLAIPLMHIEAAWLAVLRHLLDKATLPALRRGEGAFIPHG
jgi:peptidoglycan/LPS O-acetylase OafA/YrhL